MKVDDEMRTLGNIRYSTVSWFAVMYLNRWAILQSRTNFSSVRIFHDCIRFKAPRGVPPCRPRSNHFEGKLQLHCPTCGKLVPKKVREIRDLYAMGRQT